MYFTKVFLFFFFNSRSATSVQSIPVRRPFFVIFKLGAVSPV